MGVPLWVPFNIFNIFNKKRYRLTPAWTIDVLTPLTKPLTNKNTFNKTAFLSHLSKIDLLKSSISKGLSLSSNAVINFTNRSNGSMSIPTDINAI